MLKLLLLFGHLLGTCVALGAIVADCRLLGKLARGARSIAPPSPYVVRLITAALAVLCFTGAALVGLGVAADPGYLSNPKLQAKMLLVAALCLNAAVLHRITFPALARGRPLSRWQPRQFARVAVPVGVSNSLWMFCAFLGIARPWNHTVTLGFVLETAVVLVAGGVLATVGVLAFAAAGRKAGQPPPRSVAGSGREAAGARQIQ